MKCYMGIAMVSLVLAVSQAMAVNIEMVTVGDAGNVKDTQTNYGAVAAEFAIGKYEVTNTQYAQFLNGAGVTPGTNSKGLYDGNMANWGISWNGSRYVSDSGWESKPVVYVSWYDAARFANWLHNGATISADTETGVYHLTALSTVNNSYYNGELRNPDATYWIPSEDEWYKAAFYKGGSTDAGYWDYPTQSDSISSSDANFNHPGGSAIDVGSYPKGSYYGTYDQGGNVWEWNEALVNGQYRGARGGMWSSPAASLSSTLRNYFNPSSPREYNGFRIAGIVQPDAPAIPEPTSIGLLFAGLIGLAYRRSTK